MTRIIAHRGFCARHPENTPRGWIAAVEAGAHYVEADLRYTADGQAVLCHDPDLSRLAGRRERIDELRRDALAELRADHPDIAPSWDELIESVPPTTGILLDVKDERPEALAALSALLEPLAGRDIVIGLHEISSVSFFPKTFAFPILALMAGAENGPVFADAGARIIRLWEEDATTGRVRLLRARGLPVWVTTGGHATGRGAGIHDDETLRRMSADGVAGFLVDDPPSAASALGLAASMERS